MSKERESNGKVKRILFAWQLGANYGHLAYLLPIAEELRTQGHDVSFIVRDPRIAAELLLPANFSFVQAPISLERSPRAPKSPINYADLLLGAGFDDPLSLRGLTECWSNLVDSVCPDVIVADHAPMALLIAHMQGIRAISFGSGFCIPPNQSPWPSIRPWDRIEASQLQHADNQLLSHINTLLASFGQHPLTQPTKLFKPHHALVTGVPELDPFGPRSDVEYVMPTDTEPHAAPVHWLPGTARRIFAYLRPSVQQLDAVLTALETIDSQVICVLPGATQELQEHLKSTKIRLFSHRVPLASLLSTCDLVVTYGGAGTITKSLLAGVPLLVVSQVAEQYLNALRVEQLGIGLVSGFDRTEANVERALRALLNDGSYREAAKRFSRKYAASSATASMEKIISLIVG